MRKLLIALAIVGIVAGVVLLTATPSQAHCRSYPHSYGGYGPDHHWGYGCGWPYSDPYYQSYPYGYGPYWPVVPSPPVIVQPPTTYIEKQPEQKPAEPPHISYCMESDDFYPKVSQCANAWLKVLTSPPAPEQVSAYWKFCRDPGKKDFYPRISECNSWLYAIPETNPSK